MKQENISLLPTKRSCGRSPQNSPILRLLCILVFAVSLLSIGACEPPPQQTAHIGEVNLLHVPAPTIVRVFYGTNRHDHGSSTIPKFSGERGSRLVFGSIEVSVPKLHNFGKIELPEERSVTIKGVTVTPSMNPDRDFFIKRIVALGGESVSIKEKVLLIDGTPLEEPFARYLDKNVLPKGTIPRDNMDPILLDDDTVFLLGDNRDLSHDSRFFGPVSHDSLESLVLYVYWSETLARIGSSPRLPAKGSEP